MYGSLAGRVQLATEIRIAISRIVPFKHAVCANCEHIYRREVELPPAFDEDLASIAPSAYSIFTDIVLSGAKDPELEWRDYYKNSNVPIPNFRN